MDIINHGVLTLDYPSGRFSFVSSLYKESSIELLVRLNKSVSKLMLVIKKCGGFSPAFLVQQ